jgi:hypothetical protein
MKEANVRPKLHPMDDGGNGLTLLPAAPYVISKLEKTMFIKNIRELKAPSNYVGQLSKKITVDGKLQGLKSHNYHISMQQIMPLCLRTLLPKEVQVTIVRISGVFTCFCSNSVNASTMAEHGL